MRNVGNRSMVLPFESQPWVWTGAGPTINVVVADPPDARTRLVEVSATGIGGTVVLPIDAPELQSKLTGLAPTPDTAARPMVSAKPPWLVRVTV
jgi:hypothetical protein